MINWKNIHKDFGKEWSNKTYQQYWEEAGFDFQNAQEWIWAGFKPNDIWRVKEWKGHGFTSQQAQVWREIGLKERDAKFASYLVAQGCQPSPYLNLEWLREGFNTWKTRENLAKIVQEQPPKTS